MAILGAFIKQPAEEELYSIDYSEDLDEEDFIIGLEVFTDSEEVDGDNPDTLQSSDSYISEKVIKVWLIKGIDGKTYKITCRSATKSGRVIEDEFKIKIKDF